jgi:hypothetical protein
MGQFFPRDSIRFTAHDEHSSHPLWLGSNLDPTLGLELSISGASDSAAPAPLATFPSVSREHFTLSGDNAEILASLSPLGQRALRFRAAGDKERMIALQGEYYSVEETAAERAKRLRIRKESKLAQKKAAEDKAFADKSPTARRCTEAPTPVCGGQDCGCLQTLTPLCAPSLSLGLGRAMAR